MCCHYSQLSKLHRSIPEVSSWTRAHPQAWALWLRFPRF
jgi:hypothetical protein